MFILKKKNFKFLHKSFNLFQCSFSKINYFNQKIYLKSDMEKQTREHTEVASLLSELNIKETNMPEVPKQNSRYARYNFYFNS